MKMKPKTAYMIGCSFLILLGVALMLGFGAKFVSICVRLADEPRNVFLLGALRLDAGVSLVGALTGFCLTVKITQIAIKDLFFRRAR